MSSPRYPPLPPRIVRKPVAIRALLYEANWRRSDLGRALGVRPNTASTIFDGVRLLRLPEAHTLAKALTATLGRRVTMEDLVDEK